jgi:hypothetical protein
MTASSTHPTTTNDARNDAHRVSATQVTGSAVAAVAGAFCATRLGLAGTLSGVALGSIVGTLGSAYVTRHLQRARTVLPALPSPAGLPHPAPEPTAPTDDAPTPQPAVVRVRSERRGGWRQGLIAAGVSAGVSLAALVAVTMLEGLTGQPVTSLALDAGRQLELGSGNDWHQVWAQVRTFATT